MVAMTQDPAARFRHRIRPMSAFSFCGRPIVAPRDEYNLAAKDLPPCAECLLAHDKAQRLLGGRHRRLV